MNAELVAHELTKGYGPIPVLKSVNLAINSGETLAIIGPNGAGKSTLFKCLSGEVRVDGGTIHHRGQDITSTTAHERANLGFGRTFQVCRIFPNYTVLENLTVVVEARRRSQGEGRMRFRIAPDEAVLAEVDAISNSMGFAAKGHVPARFLSHGDRKQLELALIMAMQAKVLLLDEPTAGMSASDRQATVELVKSLKQTMALTVLITEHDMSVIFGLADRIVVLNYGEIVAVGAPEQVRNDPQVRSIYLGRELDRA